MTSALACLGSIRIWVLVLGMPWSNFSRQRVFTVAAFPFVSQSFSQTQGNFAFQAIAGLSVPISNVPGLAVTAECRSLEYPGAKPSREATSWWDG
jgi:hypothetical protein